MSVITRLPKLACLVAAVALAGSMATASDTRTYSSVQYRWTVSYPSSWTIDSSNPAKVILKAPAQDAMCGIMGGTHRAGAALDELADEIIARSAGFSRQETRVVSRRPVRFANGRNGLQFKIDLVPGGASLRTFSLLDSDLLAIDCETYSQKFNRYAPTFTSIARSLRHE